MKRMLFIGITALIVALGIGTISHAANPATPVAMNVLEFDVQFHDTILATSTTGLSLGDRVILSDMVLKDGKAVGTNAGVCTITDVAGVMECTVTWSLPDGTISTQFINTPPPDKVFAIVGGTGNYAGAHGTGELIENGDPTGSVSFDLTG